MKFALPKEVIVPEGVEPGDKFEALATLVVGEDGRTATLMEIDGEAISSGQEEKKVKKAAGRGFVESVMGEMEED